MKSFASFLAVCLLTSTTFAAEGWHTSYDDAVAESKKTGRPILCEFTGSDWCPPCMTMTRELMKSDVFNEWAKDNVVKLYLDFPRRTQLEAKLQEQNQGLAKKYSIRGFPTVLFIDATGKEHGRAVGYRAGLKAARLAEFKRIVTKFGDANPAVAGGPDKPAAKTFNRKWLEGTDAQRSRLDEVKAAPALNVDGWANSEALDLEKLKGKVVVIDFWATWCGTCVTAIPHNNKLADKYKDKVVFIGICHPQGGKNMAALAKEKGITFPIALDSKGKTFRSYKANGVPDYYVIDQAGQLRAADVTNGAVEDVIKFLLAEKEPKKAAKPDKKESPAKPAPESK